MIEVWEFIKAAWHVVTALAALAFMVSIPFGVVALWKLSNRLDVFARVEKIAKRTKAHPEAVWTPKEYRDAMADHEKAVRKTAVDEYRLLEKVEQEDRKKMNHPPEGWQAK